MKVPYNLYKSNKEEYLVVFSIPNLDTSSVKIKIKWENLTISWKTFSVVDELIRKWEDPLDVILNSNRIEIVKEDLEVWAIEFNETITFKSEISEDWAKAIFEKWFLIVRVKESKSNWFINLIVR